MMELAGKESADSFFSPFSFIVATDMVKREWKIFRIWRNPVSSGNEIYDIQ